MSTLKQGATRQDLEVTAGNPFSLSVVHDGATITSPVVTMKTSGGDDFAIGAPSVSIAGSAVVILWDAADTEALNTTTRKKSYRWSYGALVNGDGPFELLAGSLEVYPVGTPFGSTAGTATLTFSAGSVSVALDVAVGGAGVTVKESTTTVVAPANTLDFGAGFDVTESPSRTAAIALDLSEYAGAALPVAAGGTGSTTAAAARTALGVDAAGTAAAAIATHVAAGDPHPVYTTAAELAAAISSAVAAYQPLDADLTTIAAMSPTKGDLIVGNGSAWVELPVGTNGDILRADTAAAAGISWNFNRGQAVVSGLQVGFSSSSAKTIVAGNAYGRPINIARGGNINKFRIRVQTGAASSIVRPGFYAMTGFYTGTLVLDAGADMNTAASGIVDASISSTNLPAGQYLLVVFVAGGNPGLFAIEATTDLLPPSSDPSIIISCLSTTHAWTGGALPSTVTLTTMVDRMPCCVAFAG